MVPVRCGCHSESNAIDVPGVSVRIGHGGVLPGSRSLISNPDNPDEFVDVGLSAQFIRERHEPGN